MRQELKELSQELLGASSRYQKLLKKAQLIPSKDPITGLEVKQATYLSKEQVLELLRNMKKEKEERAKLAEVQKAAGSVGN
jgi:hypothetical protein